MFVRSIILAVVLVVPVTTAVFAQADVAGGRDHPAIGARYPEARIVRYKADKFDAYQLLTGPVRDAKNPEITLPLEGRITRISYEIPAKRSTLEVMRNYEIALKEKGFEFLFRCSNKKCGGRPFNNAVVPYIAGFGDNYRDQRYLAARLNRPEGPLHISLYVVKNTTAGGPTANKIYVRLDVIESAAMDTGLKVVKASEMENAITKAGQIALYGILFDFDSDAIKPESRPALDEIAKLLRKNTGLKVFVVGHTDNKGKLDYNLDLSQRRARAVVVDLVKTYKIGAGRLEARGLANLAPVASNRTEAGRRKNRRVVLVER
jgi:outer membrane protein OmpA-like peptidoglycan-associated protein